MFTLHPQLQADTFPVTNLKLCQVLLMNNRLFPWLILVPAREGCKDLFDVPMADQPQLLAEIRACHEALKKLTNAEKMNIGALGNMVPQLHIHLIARHGQDAAWPKPVWGGPAQAYTPAAAHAFIASLIPALAAQGLDIPTATA